MPLVELTRIPQVALPFINQDHQVEGDLLNRLHEALVAARQGGSKEPVLAAFQKLLTHTREHFGREEEAMRRADFPPYPIHKEEHDRVLAEMEAMGEALAGGGDDGRVWRYVTEAVPAWFVAHIQSMDTITAQFVAMRGG